MTTPTSTTCPRWPGSSSPGSSHHASEITAITNQWVNSYKRLIISQEDQPLIEAPVYISWAQNNRSALVRVPPTKKGKRDSTRIEYRSPDPGANPYLAWAVILAAGPGRDPGATTSCPERLQPTSTRCPPRNGWRKASSRCRRPWPRRSTPWRPPSWWPKTLGEHVFEWFLRNKRAEWAAYKTEVTPFELRRYLTAL